MSTKDRDLWWMWYSDNAARRGCPVSTYRDQYGQEILVTGITSNREGLGYVYKDKVVVGNLKDYTFVKSTYRPHSDFYRYWW
jgi:hypothetical protein